METKYKHEIKKKNIESLYHGENTLEMYLISSNQNQYKYHTHSSQSMQTSHTHTQRRLHNIRGIVTQEHDSHISLGFKVEAFSPSQRGIEEVTLLYTRQARCN